MKREEFKKQAVSEVEQAIDSDGGAIIITWQPIDNEKSIVTSSRCGINLNLYTNMIAKSIEQIVEEASNGEKDSIKDNFRDIIVSDILKNLKK